MNKEPAYYSSPHNLAGYAQRPITTSKSSGIVALAVIFFTAIVFASIAAVTLVLSL